MRLNSLTVTCALYALLLLFAAPGQAEELEELVKRCEICHGPGGNSQLPIFPSISGFTHDGFIFAIDMYREDRRIAPEFQKPGEPDMVMNNIAQQLSDEQIELLAAYYGERPYKPVQQPFDAELASRGAEVHERMCEKCHENNGTIQIDNAGIIAGQWTLYLRTQIENIISGKRITPRRMSNLFKRLTDDDIEALLNFYAQNGNGEIKTATAAE